jgi:hypothetical protein
MGLLRLRRHGDQVAQGEDLGILGPVGLGEQGDPPSTTR